MADAAPYFLSDIILGRIDALRGHVNCIIEEFSQHDNTHRGNGLKGHLGRMAQDLDAMDRMGQKFSHHDKQQVDEASKNLLAEYQWKKEVIDHGKKAILCFRQQLEFRFPQMETLNDEIAVPMPPTMFIGTTPIGQAIFATSSTSKPPCNLDGIFDLLSKKFPDLSFYRRFAPSSNGLKYISMIKCVGKNEMVIYISFSPHVPYDMEALQANDTTSSSPSTPTEDISKPTLRQRRSTQKRKDNMATKAKQVSQEATQLENDEFIARLAVASESYREYEIAKVLSMHVSNSMERISIYGCNEHAPYEAWGNSTSKVFQKITSNGIEMMDHAMNLYPDKCLQVFFAWIASFRNIYQTTCSSCKKILAKDSDDNLFLPPTHRVYTPLGAAIPHHSACILGQY